MGVIFGAYFLFEILARVGLHAMQYLLVGCSLVAFFLLLLALSEVMQFGFVYLISSSATALMIALYSRSVLNDWSRAGTVSVLLGLMLATRYLVLTMQDYSLLAGSGLVILLLAAAMFLTRNLDWRSGKSPCQPAELALPRHATVPISRRWHAASGRVPLQAERTANLAARPRRLQSPNR